MQDQGEAVFEEARCDYCVIEQAAIDVSTGFYAGPYVVPMRRDRDGRWRTPKIEPLCSGGAAKNTLTAYLTPRWYEPGDFDMSATWSVASGSTPDWQTATVITVDRAFSPNRRLFPEGDESGYFRFAWITFAFTNSGGSPAPKWSGVRIYETVDN
jgi:hypothetical protein